MKYRPISRLIHQVNVSEVTQPQDVQDRILTHRIHHHEPLPLQLDHDIVKDRHFVLAPSDNAGK